MNPAMLLNVFLVSAFGLAALYAVLKYGDRAALVLNAFGTSTATAINAAKV